MNDLISRQAAIEAISYSEIAFYPGDNEGDCLRRDSDIKQAIMALPSAEPEIIYCRDCKNHIDDFFCCKANHHTSDNECCMTVFHAERRIDG